MAGKITIVAKDGETLDTYVALWLIHSDMVSGWCSFTAAKPLDAIDLSAYPLHIIAAFDAV